MALKDFLNFSALFSQNAQPDLNTQNTQNAQNINYQNYNRTPDQQAAINQYLQSLQPQTIKKEGFLKKYGFTPGVLLQIGSGINALTGGSPYLSQSLGQQGSAMVNQEQLLRANKEENQNQNLYDYAKNVLAQESELEIGRQRAEDA